MPNPRTAESTKRLDTPNAEREIEVHAKDRPIYCPRPGTSLWNSHPRVFIPLDTVGDTHRCIYCGAVYRLVD